MIKSRCPKCRKIVEYKTGLCESCTKINREIYRKNNKDKENEHLIKNSTWKAVRLKVLQRDQGCCRVCLSKNIITYTRLEVHHIVKRTVDLSLVYEPSNLVTVCKSCHELLEKLSVVEQKEIIGSVECNDFRLL